MITGTVNFSKICEVMLIINFISKQTWGAPYTTARLNDVELLHELYLLLKTMT